MINYSIQLLRLHLAQAELALHKASNNAYSDTKKTDYQNSLKILFSKISSEIRTRDNISESEIYNSYQVYLDFIFKSLEFLDSSTLNQIPYEIVACLNFAMKDWIKDTNDMYIIVTSLINTVDGFGFDQTLVSTEALYIDIKARYNVDFPQRLVQINLPRNLSRDYLAAVVLYHELGHFIDVRYKISARLTRALLLQLQNNQISPSDLQIIHKYFPFLKTDEEVKAASNPKSRGFEILNSHIAEFFCDLFAAQYIGYSSNFFLTYLTKNHPEEPDSYHPDTSRRVKIVEQFIKGEKNYLTILINEALEKITGKELKIRYQDVSAKDFLQLLPAEVKSPDELHGIFEMSWKIWLTQQAKFSKSLNDSNPLKLYKVLNNLVEKSIGNFITINKWQNLQIKSL